MKKIKKIGVLTSGGDCGGLNATIRSIFFRANKKYNLERRDKRPRRDS